MDKSLRRVHSNEFKLQVVLALLKQEKTISQICSEFRIHPTQAKKWRDKALEGVKGAFEGKGVSQRLLENQQLIEELYKQIGQLKVELDWLKKKIGYFS